MVVIKGLRQAWDRSRFASRCGKRLSRARPARRSRGSTRQRVLPRRGAVCMEARSARGRVVTRESGAARIFFYNWPIYVSTWGAAALVAVIASRMSEVAEMPPPRRGIRGLWSLLSRGVVLTSTIVRRSSVAPGFRLCFRGVWHLATIHAGWTRRSNLDESCRLLRGASRRLRPKEYDGPSFASTGSHSTVEAGTACVPLRWRSATEGAMRWSWRSRRTRSGLRAREVSSTRSIGAPSGWHDAPRGARPGLGELRRLWAGLLALLAAREWCVWLRGAGSRARGASDHSVGDGLALEKTS